jgi:hypothetical protein
MHTEMAGAAVFLAALSIAMLLLFYFFICSGSVRLVVPVQKFYAVNVAHIAQYYPPECIKLCKTQNKKIVDIHEATSRSTFSGMGLAPTQT